MDGKEVFKNVKIYMPQSTNSRGTTVYGAHQKMGFIRDTSFQPLQPRTEVYEIPFPCDIIEKDGKTIREIKAKELEVTIELRHQLDPEIGEIGKDTFIFYTATQKIALKP